MNKNEIAVEQVRQRALDLASEMDAFRERTIELHERALALVTEEEREAMFEGEAPDSKAWRLAGELGAAASDHLEPFIEAVGEAAAITDEELRVDWDQRILLVQQHQTPGSLHWLKATLANLEAKGAADDDLKAFAVEVAAITRIHSGLQARMQRAEGALFRYIGTLAETLEESDG